MKLLVLSDSHGYTRRLTEALDAHPDARDVVFLGDGERDLDEVEWTYPDRRFYSVRGNCDLGSFLPAEGMAPFGGMNFYYTHGHLHGVKTGLELLAEQAQQMGAQVALYGHTHRARLEKWGDLILFNPGALASGSYGILTVTDGNLDAAFGTVK